MKQDSYNSSQLTAHSSQLTAHSNSCAQDTYNKPQFVVLGNSIGGFVPSAESGGALLTRKITNKFIRLLLITHISRKINRVINLPLKSIWDKLIIKGESINYDNDVYFIFTESYRLAYSRDYLRHLRKKYRKCKLIFYFRNALIDKELRLTERWNAVKDCFRKTRSAVH